ncbi:MAG: S-layer homology domain-containing protein [Lawsonibacter sp.]|jgi:hypothetical protein
MRNKRTVSTILSIALLATLTVPMGAAKSSFYDVSDPATSINADVLRLMGVVDGVGGNTFNPNGNLTRAEFCAMVVKFMQKGDQVAANATRTIFSDVTAAHWGLGYVNLAASLTVKDGEKELPLISGVGDGRFEPDAKITFAQAVTILIRVLGYSSEQAGAVWPQSYMNLAKSIGLTDGISAGVNSNITRAQAAQLFVNALGCKTGDGSDYYTSMGTPKEDVVLLAVNVDTDDGSAQGAVRTSAGTYLPKTENVEPTALQGRRGSLVLNDKQEIVTFVPDDSTAVTITLSEDAQATYVKANGGKQYTIASDTPVYTSDKAEGSSYVSAHTSLYSGSQITMFTERGKVVAVYAGGSAATSDAGAVVVTGGANVAIFHELTGGLTSFNVQKNRQAITLSQIQPYDVATYDSLSNTLIVSDLHLTCVLESAYPNSKAPEKITALGYEFEVLESAWSTTPNFNVGNQVTLLLTADGKVAGMADPSKVRSNAMGIVKEGGAQVFLPSGGTLELKGEVSNLSNVNNQLVTVSSASKGKISANRMPNKTTSSDFDVTGMKIGSYTVTAGVRIYEQVDGGAMIPIGVGDLGLVSVPSNKIMSYHLNSSDMVDYIVLNKVTGNAYEYGIMVTKLTAGEGDVGVRTWSLSRGSGAIDLKGAGYQGKEGSFAGVALGAGGEVLDIIQLTVVGSVKPSDFFQSQGQNYVNAGGKTYQVAEDVECYHKVADDRGSQDNWFTQSTGQERLDACKAYSKDLTIYVDPIGQQVRVIQAN